MRHSIARPARCVATLLILVASAPVADVRADETAPSKLNLRAMVERSLPYVQSGGASWRKSKGCQSCHRTTFTVWSLNRASERGLAVDPDVREEWNAWATDWKSLLREKDRAKARMAATLKNENDAIGQLLLGRPAQQEAENEPAWVATYREHLLSSQTDSGAWKPRGQLPQQKRKDRETQEVTTTWAMLALLDNDDESPGVRRAVARGREWLGEKTVGPSSTRASTEWWATRLMLERATGASDAADARRGELLARQRDDGGWGWLCEDDSDALGTAYALYALARDGMTEDDAEVRRGLEFLERTQGEDGSWSVRGTKKSGREKVTDTASYWGTCWAVIAALEFCDAPAPALSAAD